MIPEFRNPFASAKIVGKRVSPAAYHKQTVKRGDPAYVMSRGELMEFAHCPARWLDGFVRKDTDATEWGTLVDGLVMMSPQQFEEAFAVSPKMYPCDPKKNKGLTEKPWNYQATHCDEWRTARLAEGKVPIKHAEWIEAQEAVEVLMADESIKHLFDSSDRQVHVIAEYKDHDTGIVVQVKTLIDLVPRLDQSHFDKCVADFKSARSAHPRAWQSSVFENGYHTQGAVYLDAYTAATGEDRNTFLHPIQESYAPWQTGKRFLSHEFIELGRLKYVGALKLYCACLASGKFPGYERGEGAIDFNGFELVAPESWMLSR